MDTPDAGNWLRDPEDRRWLNLHFTCFVSFGMSQNIELAPNRLRRQNGIVAGVCGGLAEFYGIKPIWFRLLFIVLLLPGGLPGFLPYVILWIAVPKKQG